MKTVIFLGPSLPVAEAKTILDAIYLPPVQQADIVSAVHIHQPDVIGIIDGTFGQSLSVWHKEILYALHEGIPVYGASSMGALRAAELAEYGMIGLGKIYQMYASQEINDDDEVALAHADTSSDYLNLSTPMINIRMTFRAALEAGLLDQNGHDQLVALAKALYFPDRTWHFIFRQALEAGMSPEVIGQIKTFTRNNYVNVKRDDAITLLQTIRDLKEPLPKLPPFDFTRSHLFEALYERDRRTLHNETEISLDQISSYAALHLPDFMDINFHALNRELVLILAEMLNVVPTEEETQREVERFCFRCKIKTPEQLQAWLAQNDLRQTEFQRLMQDMATCRRMQRWFYIRNFFAKNTRHVLDELRLQNRYEEVASAAAEQEKIVQNNYPHFNRAGEKKVSMKVMLPDHIRATGIRMEVPPMEWATEAGFQDIQNFKIEMQRAWLARHTLKNVAAQFLDALTPKTDFPATFMPDQPSPARIYDFFLGGQHNTSIDRQTAQKLLDVSHTIADTAKANRDFMRRTVRYLAKQGINQFIDIGCNFPGANTVYDILQTEKPSARVVGIEIDPDAVAAWQESLQGNDHAICIEGDVRNIEAIFNHPEVKRLIDFSQPVAISLFLLLHFILDDAEAQQIVNDIRSHMAKGSYLALTHTTVDQNEKNPAAAIYSQTTDPTRFRSFDQVETFFKDFQLVAPGLVYVPLWHPDGEHPYFARQPAQSGMLGGVGYKHD